MEEVIKIKKCDVCGKKITKKNETKLENKGDSFVGYIRGRYHGGYEDGQKLSFPWEKEHFCKDCNDKLLKVLKLK